MSPVAAAVRVLRKKRTLLVEVVKDGVPVREVPLADLSDGELGELLVQLLEGLR